MKIIEQKKDYIIFTYYSLTYILEIKNGTIAGQLYLANTNEKINNKELLKDICEGLEMMNVISLVV